MSHTTTDTDRTDTTELNTAENVHIPDELNTAYLYRILNELFAYPIDETGYVIEQFDETRRYEYDAEIRLPWLGMLNPNSHSASIEPELLNLDARGDTTETTLRLTLSEHTTLDLTVIQEHGQHPDATDD